MNEKQKDDVVNLVLIVVALMPAMALSIKLNWNWFVVPATGWNPLTFWHAAGMQLIVGLLCFHTPLKDECYAPPLSRTGTGILFALVTMGLGWAYHLAL